LPGSYVVTQTANAVNILPETFLNLPGASQTAAPLLNQPVSFPEAARNIPATFQLIVDGMVKATGVNVVLSNVPFPDYSLISVGASQESAASVLAKITAKLRPFSCFLLYDPSAKTYHLTVRIVPFPAGSTSANQPQPGVSLGVTRPTQSHFFENDRNRIDRKRQLTFRSIYFHRRFLVNLLLCGTRIGAPQPLFVLLELDTVFCFSDQAHCEARFDDGGWAQVTALWGKSFML